MSDLDQAKQIFGAGSYSFVAVRDGQVIATGARDGIGELLDALERHPGAMQGASLADKVVGKAVALVSLHAGIRAIYTPLASQAARRVLDSHGIPLQADRLVPLIRNKRNDGPCPMERLTAPLDEPADAVTALREFVSLQALRNAAARGNSIQK